MSQEDFEFEELKGLGRAFSRVPRPAGSERFVLSVMARIRALEERAAEPFSILVRWLAPAFVAAATCLLLSVLVPSRDAVSVDSLLFPGETGMSSLRDSSPLEAAPDDPAVLLERQ